jgi:hypothetical protein
MRRRAPPARCRFMRPCRQSRRCPSGCTGSRAQSYRESPEGRAAPPPDPGGEEARGPSTAVVSRNRPVDGVETIRGDGVVRAPLDGVSAAAQVGRCGPRPESRPRCISMGQLEWLGVCATDRFRAKIASRREREEPTPTAYPCDTLRGRRRCRSRMDGDLQPKPIRGADS